MICSSVDENWMRVEIMHNVAKDYFNTANEIKSQSEAIKNLINLSHYMFQQKESCIVGMIKAWCIVTLESLANHALAENLNNKTVAISAIEYPQSIIQRFKFQKKCNSELSKKLTILNDGYEGLKHLIEIADELVATRNLIVHDKPYQYTDLGDGDFIIDEYRNRGNSDEDHHKFSNLGEFYKKCDEVAQFLLPKIEITYMFKGNINFSNLLKG